MHAAGQEVVVPTAQRVVVARAWISCNAAVQHCLENFGLQHSDLELEGSARTVVLFEGILPKAAAPGASRMRRSTSISTYLALVIMVPMASMTDRWELLVVCKLFRWGDRPQEEENVGIE